MMNDNETLLSRMLNGATSLWRGKVETRVQCQKCGEWIRKGDTSPCGSHPVLASPDENTTLVQIRFEAPKKQLEEPPKVERVEHLPESTPRPAERRAIERFSDEEQTPEQIEADRVARLNELIREHDPTALTGKPKRVDRTGAAWDMSSKELQQKMDAKNNDTLI